MTAPVTESDIDTSGALILPTSEKTTRYTGAAAAAALGATEGSTVIAGHVNFADGSPGALAPLAKIAKGTPVYLTDTTGTRHEYKANTAQTLTKTGLPQGLFAPVGPPQLVLITCGGPIDNTGSILEYTHNTVVTAAPTTVP
ncbi:class F sortase [Arthrobacter sp. zg-Y1219]|nr:class F sortase [Arthrobacter sp. zg-Y1219]MDK1358712.1 class F sortase [Arthrobacter sp. zg-Y1219]